MRIGGEIKKPYKNPTEWMERVKELKYSAVHAPIGHDASYEERRHILSVPRRIML